MPFANRRLGGNADAAIKNGISAACDLPTKSIYLCGLEQLEMWLKQFPEVPEKAKIDPVDSPLLVSPDELADVVEALASHKKNVGEAAEKPPSERFSYERKNTLNHMSEEYAKQLIKRYLKESATIQSFLSAPENFEITSKYQIVVDEFQLNITAKRKDHQTFDEIMNYLADLLFNRDVILSRNKRLTRAMIFYMYWNCDIGKTEDAETD